MLVINTFLIISILSFGLGDFILTTSQFLLHVAKGIRDRFKWNKINQKEEAEQLVSARYTQNKISNVLVSQHNYINPFIAVQEIQVTPNESTGNLEQNIKKDRLAIRFEPKLPKSGQLKGLSIIKAYDVNGLYASLSSCEIGTVENDFENPHLTTFHLNEAFCSRYSPNDLLTLTTQIREAYFDSQQGKKTYEKIFNIQPNNTNSFYSHMHNKVKLVIFVNGQSTIEAYESTNVANKAIIASIVNNEVVLDEKFAKDYCTNNDYLKQVILEHWRSNRATHLPITINKRTFAPLQDCVSSGTNCVNDSDPVEEATVKNPSDDKYSQIKMDINPPVYVYCIDTDLTSQPDISELYVEASKKYTKFNFDQDYNTQTQIHVYVFNKEYIYAYERHEGIHKSVCIGKINGNVIKLLPRFCHNYCVDERESVKVLRKIPIDYAELLRGLTITVTKKTKQTLEQCMLPNDTQSDEINIG